MSVWLPRAPAPLLLRTFSRHPHLLVSVRTYAAASQQSRLPFHPLYASGYGRVKDASAQQEPRRELHSSPVQQDAPTTSSTTNDPKALPPAPKDDAPLATRVWKKVKHEVQHYWHGSKLLAAEVRISSRLQWKLLHGESLTRRERRQVRMPCASSGAPRSMLTGTWMLAAQADDTGHSAAHPVRRLRDRAIYGAAHPCGA